jgi:hypothetical protein
VIVAIRKRRRVGAVEGEVAQRRELALDPVQPGCVRREEDEFDLVGGAPRLDGGVLVSGEIVGDQVELLAWPAGISGLHGQRHVTGH